MPLAAPDEDNEQEARDSSDLSDDKDAAYRDPGASQDQKDAFEKDFGNRGTIADSDRNARPGGVNNQPGGASADAAAAGRAGTATPSSSDDIDRRLQTPVGGHKTGETGKIRGRLRRRLIIGGGIGLLVAGLPVLFFVVLLPLKLIHIEENITNYFDKRLQHTIDQRMGAHFRAIFDDAGNARGYKYATGHPLSDAYHNYNLNRLEGDMKAQGLSAVHDTGGKLVGFTQDTGTDTSSDTHATLEGEQVFIKDASGRTVDTISTSDEAHFADLRGTKLSDRRNFFRTTYADRYPELGFFRLSVRARALDVRFGIKRRFLENLHEKVTDKKINITTQIKDAFTARVSNSDGASDSGTGDEQAAKQEDEKTVSDHGDDAKGGSVKDVAAGGFGILFQACAGVGIINTLNNTLLIIRESQLMRVAFVFLSTADQLKRGDLHPSQLSAMMSALNGYEKAPGWQRITGDKSVKVTDSNKYSLNGGSTVTSVHRVLAGIPILGTLCGAVNSVSLPEIALFDAGLAASSETGIPEAVEAGVTAGFRSIGSQLAFGEAIKEVVSLATDAESKPVIDWTSSSAGDKIDATVAGYDSYSQNNERANGGERLTAGAVAELNQASDEADAQSAQAKGLAYQMFSTAYDHSLTSDLILKAPTSPQDVAHGFMSAFAVITSPFSHKQLTHIGAALLHSSSSASAYSEVYETEDPSGYGVPQQGIPDALLAAYPDPSANEDAVISYLCRKGQTLYDGQNCADPSASSDSSGELTDKNDSHDDDYHQFVNACLLSDDQQVYLESSECTSADPGDGSKIYDRFRVYRFDLGLSNMNVSYNNDTNDQDPNGGSSSGTTTTPPVNGSAPCNSMQACAQQIKQLTAQGKISYAIDASEIEANIDLEANGQNPKFDGDGETITTASPLILEAVVALAQQGKVQLNSYIDGNSHTASDNPHHMGQAMDVGSFEGKTLGSGDVAETKKAEQIVGQVLPAHSRFGADFYTDSSWTAPISLDGKQFYTGQDAPAHLHFDVVGVSGS